MLSSQILGQSGQQLIFDSFGALAQPAADRKQPRTNRVLGRTGERAFVKPFRFPASPYEYKVVPIRECPTPDAMQLLDTPQKVADYWRLHIPTHPFFKHDCECLIVFLLNTRRRVKGHDFVSTGTLDTLLVQPREVFRLAVATAAAAVVLAHNHPSGDPTPSEADIKVTRDLIRAGQLMKIEVLDHIVMGNPNHTSLREQGYFYS